MLLLSLLCTRIPVVSFTVLFMDRAEARGFFGDSFGLFLPFFKYVFVCVFTTEPLSDRSLCDCPLPNPDMSFHMWTEELDICE